MTFEVFWLVVTEVTKRFSMTWRFCDEIVMFGLVMVGLSSVLYPFQLVL